MSYRHTWHLHAKTYAIGLRVSPRGRSRARLTGGMRWNRPFGLLPGQGPRRGVTALLAVTALAAALLPVAVAGPAGAAPVAFTSTAADQGSSLCLTDPNSQTATGVQLTQHACGTASNQSWTFTPVSGTANTYTVKSFSGLCADISGRSTADNAQVIQW